jgi:outer membrane protein OmpA-like peptidoglycan-associated protein
MIPALCFFLVGAIAGLFLAVRHFTRKRLPPSVAIVHGVVGATGFAFLLFSVVRQPAFTPPKVALGILIVGIAFGLVNAVYHIRGQRHRSALIVAHALIAFGGVATLGYGIVLSLTSEQTTPPASTVDAGAASAAPLAATPASPSIAPAASAALGDRETPSGAASVASTTPSSPTTPSLGPGLAFTTDKVTFDGGSATLNGTARAALTAIAQQLKRAPQVQLVEIQGYADPRGDDATNVTIARARARAVRDGLVALGVSAARLRSAGYGARCPLDPACTAASCPPELIAHERRVAFVILEANGERFRGPVTCSLATNLIPREDAAYHSAAPGSSTTP